MEHFPVSRCKPRSIPVERSNQQQAQKQDSGSTDKDIRERDLVPDSWAVYQELQSNQCSVGLNKCYPEYDRQLSSILTQLMAEL